MIKNKNVQLTAFISALIISITIGKNIVASPVIKDEAKGYIAVVIDDFGNRSEGTEDMLNLGIPVTAAVMPFLETSAKDAAAAIDKGHEVILHLPMEPEIGKASWLGPKGITVNLSTEEIENRVMEGLDNIKYATGINNHTGSKAMKDERVVSAVLKIVKEKRLSFLDSKTTDAKVAERICSEEGIKYYKRDLFLDHNNNIPYIEKQLEAAGDKALKEGYAIVIGHVGPAGGKTTVQALKNKIRTLQDKGIVFVRLSDIPISCNNHN
ncbi:divergent polysaccharide deacetylase family protein [Alloiococcus sp. CFN-8]|uniref:divergent polysaccharide deacetylase family protein n=1 Tax=Alloiococcus sp. CFN-8 TaxID=3416081 RepID=UPI003CEE245E